MYHFNQSELDIQKLEVFSEEEKKYIKSFIVSFPAGGGLPGHYVRSSYQYSQKIYNAIKNKLAEYDFIYTKGFTGWHLIHEKKAGRVKCAPVAVKFHGYEMFQKAPDFKTKLQQILFLREPVKFISQNADLVFSYGGKITSIIESIGVAKSKIVELPSGVEESSVSDSIRPTASPIKFLYLGRYERRKGIEELNAALKEITSANFEFHFIGPIPEEKRLNKPHITYHGEVRDKTALNTLIKKCDVLVCPSWSEGMPNVILEAMACGLAVIATDAGATNVLVNEKTGWLIPESSPVLIKREIEKVAGLASNDIDVKKKAALHLIKEKFTWEKLVQQLISVIAQAKK